MPKALEDNEDASLDIDRYLGAQGRPVELGHAGLGTAFLRAAPAAHELEAGDRHLPRALSLPLPASRHGVPCSSDNIATYERMGNHMRWAAAKRSLTELEETPKENWRIRDHAIVFYSLFPNTVLTYTQDHCGVFSSFPITPDESVLQFSVLVPPEEKAKARELLEGQRRPVRQRPGRGSRHRRGHPEELPRAAPIASRPSASSRRRWAGTTRRSPRQSSDAVLKKAAVWPVSAEYRC